VAALALPSIAGLPQGPGDPTRVQALYSEQRYGEALDAARRLDDPVLAAEWRTYLFLAGGDYPGALRAAREGLAVAPQHRGLLSNATHVALTLGLADEALGYVQGLESALAAQGAAGDELERADALRVAALEQRALQQEGHASLGRARAVVGVVFLLLLGSLLALALRPVSAQAPR
jgi:hypothetical protein